jgi:hypothetical protein
MQPNHFWQEQTLARFIQTSRLHLGLMQAPVAVKPPRRVAGPYRQILRSLLVAGSLGALFSGPAFACEASTQSDPAKRSDKTQSTRFKSDDRGSETHKLSLHDKNR